MNNDTLQSVPAICAQILHNYLKHQENAVVASMTFDRIGIRERWNICRSVRWKCSRNVMACETARWISEGSVICVVANPIEKFATRQRLGRWRWKN